MYGKRSYHFVLITACKTTGKAEGKEPYPEGLKRGAHLPYWGLWAHRWMDHLSPWRTASVTPDLRLPSHLRASPPFDHRYQIILFGEQRHTCVNNLLRVVTWQWTGWELNQQTCNHQSDMLPLHNQTTEDRKPTKQRRNCNKRDNLERLENETGSTCGPQWMVVKPWLDNTL